MEDNSKDIDMNMQSIEIPPVILSTSSSPSLSLSHSPPPSSSSSSPSSSLPSDESDSNSNVVSVFDTQQSQHASKDSLSMTLTLELPQNMSSDDNDDQDKVSNESPTEELTIATPRGRHRRSLSGRMYHIARQNSGLIRDITGPKMNKEDIKGDYKSLLLKLLPLLILLALSSWLIIWMHSSWEKQGFLLYEYEAVRRARVEVVDAFSIVISDIIIIRFDKLLLHYVDCMTESKPCNDTDTSWAKTMIAENYLTFCKSKYSLRYDQIRFLNSTGSEVIRINYNNSYPFIVPDEDLQSKQHRYYFTDVFAMNYSDDVFAMNYSDDVYISPLDLNIEHSAIELPFKPMIRIGSPVFNANGQKVGIVLLNFMAQTLLNMLTDTRILETDSNVMLLDRNGYFLLNSDNADTEWGFMYDENSLEYQNTFGNKYGLTEWNLFKQLVYVDDTIQFETSDGIFSVSIVCPLASETWQYQAHDDSVNDDHNLCSTFGDYYWYIVLHKSNAQITTQTQSIELTISIMIGPFLLTLLVIIVAIVRRRWLLKVPFPAVKGSLFAIIAAVLYRLYLFEQDKSPKTVQ